MSTFIDIRFFILGLFNVTFRHESSILQYRSNGKIRHNLTSVSLSFRTRQSLATLFHAQKETGYLTVSLLNSHLVMELKSGADMGSPKVAAQSLGLLSNGEWHTVEIRQTQASTWIVDVDRGKENITIPKTAVEDFNFLKDGADIFLGGLSQESGVNLSGCLGRVEIGGLLLPFYLDTELNLPRPQEEQFVRINGKATLQYGCWGAMVCTPNPCQNEGTCEDLFDLQQCKCNPEWTGSLCQESTDSCSSSPCIYGNCTNQPEGFRCECELGFTGEQCEVDVDTCENSSCSYGATCLKGFQSYTCLCPRNMTGHYCE